MTTEQLLQEFGHLANAPEGVERLRMLILDLAVRGRLVPQDPDDEASSVLRERIIEERMRSEAEKRGRRSKPLAPIADQDVPYRAPQGWEWVPLGEPFEFMNGRAFKPSEWGSEGIRIIRIANITDPEAEANRYDGHVDERHLIDDGDLLLSWSATLRASIWRGGQAALNQHIFRVDSVADAVLGRYGEIALTALIGQLQARTHGSAMQHITKARLLPIPFPLPPAAEQRRIVERVDELTAVCDELDAEGDKAANLREATARSALSAIVESDRTSLGRAITLIDDHLRLALTPGDGAADVVAELRKGILDLAARGRLVPQDSRDEPASVLLARVGAERERLIAEKKMVKPRRLPSLLGEHELVAGTPEGWATVRLGDFAHLEYGKSLAKDRRDPSGDVPVMGANGVMGWCHEALVDGPGLVVGRKGSAGAVTDVEGPYWPTDVTYFVRGVANASLGFTSILLRTLRLPDRAKGIKPGLDRNEVHELVVAVPPADEQRRIVKRVEELMGLCDELERQLLGERELAADLAESAVRSLIAQVA